MDTGGRSPSPDSHLVTRKGSVRQLGEHFANQASDGTAARLPVPQGRRARGAETASTAVSAPQPPRSSLVVIHQGHLFPEREWPEYGELQLQDGVDRDCCYCKFDLRKEFGFMHSDHADRRFDTTDVLHEHVRTWHMEHDEASHPRVILSPKILCRNGQDERNPDVYGPIVNSTQIDAAETFGNEPAWPANILSTRRSESADEVGEEVAKTSAYDDHDDDTRQYYLDRQKPGGRPFPQARPLEDQRRFKDKDIKGVKLYAFVRTPKDTKGEWVYYREFLKLNDDKKPCAINQIKDQYHETEEYLELCNSHQRVLVQFYKRTKDDLDVVKEQWKTYKRYLELEDEKRMVLIKDMRDGLNAWHPYFAELKKKSYQKSLWWNTNKEES